MLPEERARVKIDKQLKDAGWDIVSRSEYVPNTTAAIKEALMQGNTESDYLLFVEDKAIAVVEAKKESSDLGKVVADQAEGYASHPQNWYGLWFLNQIPLVYLANGNKIYFKNMLTDPDGEYVELTAMHSPKKMFRDVLFSDAHGDVATVQDNMDRFIDEYNALLQKYFPRNWSFKQDRHSASVFLAMNDPDFNYPFKASEAQTMAKYLDFGFSIGAGTSFSLPNYYRLCEEVVAALKEHESLLEKHFSRLTNEYYRDQSLHLLAFDLMYCCRTYNFYRGLTVPSTGKTIRKRNHRQGYYYSVPLSVAFHYLKDS